MGQCVEGPPDLGKPRLSARTFPDSGQDRSGLPLAEARLIVVNECVCGAVEFSFHRRAARQVFLCGEFNDWHQTANPMRVTDNGWWKCRLRLAPGAYRFKYLADSEWYLDYAAFGLQMGPPGTWDSVVLVREEPEEAEVRQASSAAMGMPGQSSQVLLGPPVSLGPLDGHTLRRRANETTNDGVEVLV
jgi:hypothetical protein